MINNTPRVSRMSRIPHMSHMPRVTRMDPAQPHRSIRPKNFLVSLFRFCARFMRLVAYCLVVLVIGLYGSSGFLYPFFVKAEIVVSRVLPLVLRGFATIPTIFNGAFRGDIALLALACFLLDWLFVRLAHLVRS